MTVNHFGVHAMHNALRQVTGRIHHFESFGAVDGPGLRFVLFLAGCPLRCLYCHNPDAIFPASGSIWTAGKAQDEVMKYWHFIRKGGVTLSGGEPLLQPEYVRAITLLLKESGLHVAIDTSGCIGLSIPGVKAAIDSADMLLLDIKAADNETAIPLTGQTLDNALATLAYCEQTSKPVWIRHVLLDGYTLASVHTEKLANMLASYRCIKRVELLPFHKLGEPKWKLADMAYKLTNTPATTAQAVQTAKNILLRYGLPAQ